MKLKESILTLKYFNVNNQQLTKQSLSTADSIHWEMVSKSWSGFMSGCQKDSHTPISWSDAVPLHVKSWASDVAPMKSYEQMHGKEGGECSQQNCRKVLDPSPLTEDS